MHPCLFLLSVAFIVFLAGGCGGGNSPENGRYPNRRIKIIVPFRPGGETDTFARIIEEGIEKNHLVDVPLVIFNKDGAGATVGSRFVKNAPPDGYTVLLLHNALFTAKYSGQANYGPEAFAPVAGTGEFGMVVAVAEGSRFANLKDLMAEAKEHPKTIKFGINLGTPSHFAALMLENITPGAKFLFSQSGSGVDRYSEVRGGHVDLSAFSIGEYKRFEGLRALAYFGKKRHPNEPDIPTAREQGFDVVTSNMQFWWFPKGTPKERVDYLAGVLHKAMETDEVRKKLANIHCDPEFVEGKELVQRIADYTRKLEKVSLRATVPLPNFPVIVLSIALGLASIVVVRRWTRHGHRFVLSSSDIRKMDWWQWICVSSAATLTILYVLVMYLEMVPYPLATGAFVLLLGIVLTRFRLKSLGIFLVLALVLGFGLYYLFTGVFVIDLP